MEEGEEVQSGTCVRQSEFGIYKRKFVRVRPYSGVKEVIDLSPRGARVPAPDHTPSTQAPFRPITARTKRSSSWSNSIFACRRETLLREPRSTSTVTDSAVDDVAALGLGAHLRPIVTERV